MLNLSNVSLTTPEPKSPGSKDCITYKPGQYPMVCRYFQMMESGSAKMFASTKGASTKSTKRTRTELRETDAAGRNKNFLFSDNDHHFLRTAVSINQVCKKGRVVIAQVHCDDSTEPMLKVFYDIKGYSDGRGDIVASFREDFSQDEPKSFVVQKGVPMNTRFALGIHVTKAGSVSVNSSYSDNGETPSGNFSGRMGSSYAQVPLYFKAGLYNQEDPTSKTGDDEGSACELFKFEIVHE